MSGFFSKWFGRKSATEGSPDLENAKEAAAADPVLTFIVTYYNQGSMLTRLIDGWEAWPDEVKARVKEACSW